MSVRANSEKCNSLCYRGSAGGMAFFAMMAGIAAIIMHAQTCCGPQWSYEVLEKNGGNDSAVGGDDDESPFRRKLVSASDIFLNTADDCAVTASISLVSGGNWNHMQCYTRNIWSMVLAMVAFILCTASVAVCCVGNAVNSKTGPDVVAEMQQYAEQQRMDAVIRMADKDAKAARKAKKQKRKERQEKLSSVTEEERMSSVIGLGHPQMMVSGYPYVVSDRPVPVPSIATPSMLYRVV